MCVHMVYVNFIHNAPLLFRPFDPLGRIFHNQSQTSPALIKSHSYPNIIQKQVDALFISPFSLPSCFITLTNVPVRICYELAFCAIAGTVNH